MILSIKPEKAGRMESAITSSFFLGALVSLVVITNPLTKIPLFLSLTEGWSSGRRRSEAAHAALDAFFIMVTSLVAGNLLLSFFGISYGAMRIAGGFVVAVIGNQMLFGVKTPNDSEHGEKGSDGCAFFPLAMPGIAGPGTIAVVIGFSTQIAEADGLQTKAAMFAAVTAAAALSSFLTWAVMRGADSCSKALGPSGTRVLTKIMGFLLISIGIQFVGSGILTFFPK